MLKAHNDPLREAVADHTFVPELAGRLDVGCRSVERWHENDTFVMRFQGGTADSEHGEVLDVAFERMQAHFRLLTDTQLDLCGGQTTLTGAPLMWRTLWVCRDSSLDLVTTSLKLSAFLLGGLQPEELAPTQFLMTGTLGPVLSWDRRVRQIGPRDRIVFGQDDGEVTISDPTVGSASSPPPISISDKDARSHLGELITAALRSKLSDPSGWVLPLSGGHDSRGILMMLPVTLPTITWGARSSLADGRSDSAVAARLAAATETSNRFIEVTRQDLPPEQVLSAFIAASEGRIDHIEAYTDGLSSWRSLALSGVTGVVRGDEAFGWVQRTTELGVRRSIGALARDDVLKSGSTRNITGQDHLWQLQREHGASLASWRDSLYRAFRIPAVLAPLNQVKAGFVDVVCPLLDPSVVTFAAGLDDDQRTDKRIFAELVQSLSPKVPFALRSAVPSGSFGRRTDVQAMLIQRLANQPPDMFDPDLVAALCSPSTPGGQDSKPDRNILATAKRIVRSAIPERFIRRVARRRLEGQVVLDDDTLRMRMVMADDAVDLLHEWGVAGKEFLNRRP